VSACSHTPATSNNGTSVDVEGPIRNSLERANLKDVSVKQDRDKGVITLTGHVASDAEKAQAETVAKDLASGQVVANEIVVTPAGAESDAKKMANSLDDGIEQNFKAVLIQNKLDDAVNYSSKAGVLTLTGNVRSQATRSHVETLAAAVPNVKQVVNELQVKDQKATTTQK